MYNSDPLVIIGAGAAGLMAGIWAGRVRDSSRESTNREILLLDSAERIGRKILIAGGGRCNVTHHRVTEDDYAGGSRNAIKKVLRQFDVDATIDFFAELGVTLKQEKTGKLFPTSDRAQTVLGALVTEFERFGTIRFGHCVEAVVQQDPGASDSGFVVTGTFQEICASRVILATGGKSIPKTGSNGHGYVIAEALGHSVTERIFPALVPLTIPRDHWFRDMKGITLETTLELWSGSRKRLKRFTNSTLFAHFGLSGPGVLDMSRYFLDVRSHDPSAALTINWLPSFDSESFSNMLKTERTLSIKQMLRQHLPDRLVRELLAIVFDPVADKKRTELAVNQLSRGERRELARVVTRFVMPVVGDRGFDYAEVTAGGVPLTEIHLNTMASRKCSGLSLCGEILNVDGRIGGFNFQWAWASGYLAGRSV